MKTIQSVFHHREQWTP